MWQGVVLMGIVIYDGGVLNCGPGRRMLRFILNKICVSTKTGKIASAFFFQSPQTFTFCPKHIIVDTIPFNHFYCSH